MGSNELWAGTDALAERLGDVAFAARIAIGEIRLGEEFGIFPGDVVQQEGGRLGIVKRLFTQRGQGFVECTPVLKSGRLGVSRARWCVETVRPVDVAIRLVRNRKSEIGNPQ